MTSGPVAEAPRVLLLCGGRSGEHEVSLASAASVLEAAEDRAAWTPRVIARDGRLLGEPASRVALATGRSDAPDPDADADLLSGLAALERGSYDVVFPLLHGPNGEDGTVQGLLTVAGWPFVGSGVLGSAVSMDKLLMKRLFAAHRLPQVDHRGLARGAWRADPAGVIEGIDLPLPVFVKPANLGSSVGIRRVRAGRELPGALEEAFRLDRRVIVERGLEGAREVEVAVLGNDDPEVSAPGEIRYGSDFYDYATKYTEGRAELVIPAPLEAAVAARVQELARRAFLAVDAAGLARVDLFVRDDGEVLVNEINTLPGFTRTSMYPKLWQAAGLPYPDLILRLVALALEER